MASPKTNIGASLFTPKTRKRRRNLSPARRQSKTLGPKSGMRGDRGKH